MILLERPFKPQELRRGEGGADPLGFPGERAVKEHAILGNIISWGQREGEREGEGNHSGI